MALAMMEDSAEIGSKTWNMHSDQKKISEHT